MRIPWPSLLLLAACGGDSTPPSCLPQCTADRSYDAQAYTLRATIDLANPGLAATEDISVVVTGPPVIELDARVEVSAVRAGDRELAFAVDKDDAGDPARLRVDLSPLDPGSEPVTFTVEYLAQPSDALRLGGPRDDDPNPSVVLFTDSEPDRAPQWLVVKDDPSDRALWSVELEVSAERDVVANGARLADEPTPRGHRVRYALDKPLPTYMMAFAAGDLAHDERTTGRVPLSVWYRKGLPVDPAVTLDDVADAMATFERLLGPYPFDSYGVFLAPGYGGGMENATMTFNAESSGLGNGSFVLNAHELAHHWFGDWVTMRGYDDVWVKEGMATLLESEADRARRDRTASGRLFGHDMSFTRGEAVVDPELVGLDKYTSGPYQRAAWTITQIRSVVGETAFWASLRRVLSEHALDSITGEEFLRTFPLTEPQIQQVLGALRTHDSPVIAVSANGASLTFTVTDPGRTLLAPIGLTAIDAAGTATPKQLAPGAAVTIDVAAGGYLATDETDVHPYWPFSFEIEDADYTNLIANALPQAAGALTAFAARSPAQQERSLDDAGLPSVVPADITALYAAVDSNTAQRSVVFDACGLVRTLPPADVPALIQAIEPLVRNPAVRRFSTTYGACGPTLTAGNLAAELTQLAANVTPATAGRLDYLMSFDYGPAGFTQLAQIATSAPTLALRDRAVQRLGFQARGSGYSPVPTTDAPAWRAFFRERLGRVTSSTRFLSIWRGVVGLADAEALPLVAPLLHSVPLSAFSQRQVVCDAHRFASAPAFTAFQQATQPWTTLAPDAQAVLADPAKCTAPQRLAAPDLEPLRGKAAREARD